MIVMLMTGMRIGEMLGLKWSDLDGSTLRIQRAVSRGHGRRHILGPTKTSQNRSVPIGDRALRALQRHRVTLAGHGPKAAGGSGNGNGSTPRARQSSGETKVKQQPGAKAATNRVATHIQPPAPPASSVPPLSVRIELNLPVSDKQEVYDNIFRSIRENLLTVNTANE